MRSTTALLVVAVALVVGGCGEEPPSPGTLTIAERWTEVPGFIEGHVAYASIADPHGREIASGRSDLRDRHRPFLMRRLEPGRYRVGGYIRSCAPTCDPETADPPSHRCSALVEVDGDMVVTFVRAHPDDCHIEIDQPPQNK